METDVYMGYQTDIFYLYSSTSYLVANPTAYIDIAIKSYLQLNLILVQYFIHLDLVGFQYTPLDLTFLWNLN